MAPILANAGGVADYDHARRDPDPAPCRRVWPAFQGSDRRTQCKTRPDRLLGIVFMRRGITEENEQGVAEMADDEAAVPMDNLRDTVPKNADCPRRRRPT